MIFKKKDMILNMGGETKKMTFKEFGELIVFFLPGKCEG